MSNVNIPQEDDSFEDEIESPADGPTPDWMKLATSSSSKPSLTAENTPSWLKNIQAGKAPDKAQPAPAPKPVADTSGMSDLERLLAEEGIDLKSVSEERPTGSEGMSARDWMIATSDDEMIRKRVGSGPLEDEDEFEEEEAEEDPFAGMSDIERMLAEEGIDLKSVSEERPTGSEGMSARDWMISTSDEAMIRKRVGAEPLEQPAPPSPAPKPKAKSAPAPKPIVPEEEAASDADLPDWLKDVANEEPEIPEPVAGLDEESFLDTDLPDWLQQMPDEEEEELLPVIEESDDGMIVEEDLPDWLRDIETEEKPAKPVVAAGGEDDKMVVEEQLPDWLRDVEEEVSAAPSPVAELLEGDLESADEDLPDWLRDVEEEVSIPAPALNLTTLEKGDGMVVDEDLPDWLQEDEEEEEAELAEPVLESTEDDRMVVADDLPDWLRDAEEEPKPIAANEDDLPGWLKEVEAEDEEFEFEAEASEATATDDVIEQDELPDWLQEAQVETEEDLFAGESVAEFEADNLGDEDLDTQLPDWLNEVSIEEEFGTPEPTAEEAEFLAEEDDEEGLPDWLKQVQAKAEVAEAKAEPAPVATQPEAEAEEVAVVEEELPDWLRAVEPEAETEPEFEEVAEPEPVAAAVQPVVTPVVPAIVEAPVQPVAPVAPPPKAPVIEKVAPGAAMPDWLRKLREGGDEPVVAPVLPSAQPVPVVAAVAPVAAVPEPQPVVRAQVVAPPARVVEPERREDDLPESPDERLKLARTARDNGQLTEAVRVYNSLVARGAHLDTVIDDMELTIRSYPSNYMLYQIMGDAMMKDGRLQGALDAYRKALEKLSA